MGDGSIIPSPIYRPWFPIIGCSHWISPTSDYSKPRGKFKNPLLLFKNLDIVLLLIFNGIVYSVFYAVTASISSLFANIYPFLDDTTIGLCYLPIGVGTIIGSVGSGKLLDWDFRRIKKSYLQSNGSIRLQSSGVVDDFPVEKVER